MTDPSFSAIRISLASPDQIQSWSYGEVTKPETINYRNQKPEKDGLFDERIFGPTKDFECYCGKYKRIRYRGVICDRCGVEVTRANVRRERMGHINLAAPVAHIWFAKGTPSWMAMLLDMTPRNLERILYYAQYVVIEVDEERKDTLLDDYATQEDRLMEEIRAELNASRADIRERVEQEIADFINPRRGAALVAADTRRATRQAQIESEVEAVRSRLSDLIGKTASETLSVRDHTVVEAGADITEDSINAVNAVLAELVAEVAEQTEDEELAADLARLDEEAQEEAERVRQAAAEEIRRVERDAQERTTEARKAWDARRGEVEELIPRRILTESRYHELHEQHGSLFRAGMGAEALLEIVGEMNLEEVRETLHQEAVASTGQKAKKAAKRLRVVEGLRKSENKPEWMVLTVLPVLPPDLRPMVQLDGGRFATSDLNDLYRRVINRNNRLKRLMDLGAPEIIVRNEKRMLQEAVDALIDNGRRGRAITGSHNHTLKSLSDMLRGKQGRFRQNLLGKRVDYSGRSVIVVGSTLKLHQCGLPKRMALELFKPFVMHRLVLHGAAPNIKSAKRMVDRLRPEVWDLLEEVIQERPVFLNRAPTLHRLGIQAFEPVLVEGSAIQIHPLVCAAYNADFDGDQMAVHVPIGRRAVEEARKLMISTHNMLLPSSGEPIVAPTLDIVAGIYHLTSTSGRSAGEDNGAVAEKRFITYDDAKLAYDLGQVDLRAQVTIREGEAVSPDGATRKNLLPRLSMSDDGHTEIVEPNLQETFPDGWALEPVTTTVGRILFNQVLPGAVTYRNAIIDKKALKEVVTECHRYEDNESTALILDALKNLGFHYATESGLTIALSDLNPPGDKAVLLQDADERTATIERNYQRGLLSEDEKEEKIVEIWQDVDSQMRDSINRMMTVAEQEAFGVKNAASANLDLLTPTGTAAKDGYSRDITMMASSGAKGNDAQIKQMVGMRGLMADPKGKILPLPIRSSFRDGLSVLEYFISTHGARKGLADTALRTADSGYLTRRIIDVAQDVIANDDDCGAMDGVWIDGATMDRLLGTLTEHIRGRMAAAPVADPNTGEIIVDRNEEIDEEKSDLIVKAGITRVFVRSPLTCQAPRGMCRFCYGRSLARGRLVERGEAIGIIAAQSIGEPGTQLTMRTFHTGGDASVTDITSGLPRVEEIFEARVPKGAAPISEIDGVADVIDDQTGRRVRVINEETVLEEYAIPEGFELKVESGAFVDSGAELAAPAAKPATRTRRTSKKAAEAGDETAITTPAPASVTAAIAGEVTIHDRTMTIVHRDVHERTYPVSQNVRILVETGQRITAGTALAEGPLNPQDVLRIRGKDEAQRYLVDEVQRVYRSQGVVIHDKHIEIIVRQMLRRVRIEQPGDTEFLQGELIDRYLWQSVNEKVIAEGGEPSIAQPVLLGVTKVSLSTESFLAAASFQETTRVLTEAALLGKVDRLAGLKENVIIGRLIPARLGVGDDIEDDLLEGGGIATALADRDSDELFEDDKTNAGLERIFNAAFGEDSDDDDWNFDEDDEDNDLHDIDDDENDPEINPPL